MPRFRMFLDNKLLVVIEHETRDKALTFWLDATREGWRFYADDWGRPLRPRSKGSRRYWLVCYKNRLECYALERVKL